MRTLSYGTYLGDPGLGIILIMLTLGIGATSRTLFTVFDAIVLRPLHDEKPKTNWCSCGARAPKGRFSSSRLYPDYLDVKKKNKYFCGTRGSSI